MLHLINQTATLSVIGIGTAPLDYQWRKNGTTRAEVMAPSWTTQATNAGDDEAQFTLVVSNTAGSSNQQADLPGRELKSNGQGVQHMKPRLGRLGLIAVSVLAAYPLVLSQAHAQTQISPLPTKLSKEFASEAAKVHGITLHYVRGGKGPAVILIHGFPQDWFEYHAIMPRLAKQFTVVAVDLRGVGGSTATSGGYDAANLAEDLCQLVSALKLERAYMVGHDIGGMVAYAFVRRYPQATRGAMILDVPLPGIEGWEEIQGHPSVWHIRFMQVPGLPEKLVAGRQAEYFGYFFKFGKFTSSDVVHYAKAYAAPAQLHAAFEMYRAFPANAQFNAAQRGPNDVPLFLGAGDQSPFAKLVPKMADGLRANGCTHVETGLIPGSVHYVVADQPEAVAALIERYASLHSE